MKPADFVRLVNDQRTLAEIARKPDEMKDMGIDPGLFQEKGIDALVVQGLKVPTSTLVDEQVELTPEGISEYKASLPDEEKKLIEIKYERKLIDLGLPTLITERTPLGVRQYGEIYIQENGKMVKYEVPMDEMNQCLTIKESLKMLADAKLQEWKENALLEHDSGRVYLEDPFNS